MSYVFGQVNDNDENLLSKGSFGSFGLNKAVYTKIEINRNAGKDNTPTFAIDVEFMVNGSEVKTRIFDVTRVFGKNNQILTDDNSEEYKKAYSDQMTQTTAVITHLVKGTGVNDAQIQALFASGPAANFEDWCAKMLSLVPTDYKGKEVDLFLEYQWNISPNQDKTFLEIPRTMKGGRFICPATNPVGSWMEQRSWVTTEGKTEEGLRYVDNSGAVHPFTRTKTYMESNRANQQFEQTGDQVLNQIQGNAPQTTW